MTNQTANIETANNTKRKRDNPGIIKVYRTGKVKLRIKSDPITLKIYRSNATKTPILASNLNDRGQTKVNIPIPAKNRL